MAKILNTLRSSRRSFIFVRIKKGYLWLYLLKNVVRESRNSIRIKIKMFCPNNHKCEMSFRNFHNNNYDCYECARNNTVHKREKICREIFNDLTSELFKEYKISKTDPILEILLEKYQITLTKNSLSLDGLSRNLNIAFEHHGQQHYEHIPFYHRKPDSFKRQQVLDKIKREWCSKNKISLIEIKYSINERDLIQAICKEIKRVSKIKLNRLQDINHYKNLILNK